jgi:hypothetical protein
LNRDDIIRMAREADAEITNYINYVFDENVILFGVDQLERFAALVRADEREACARMAEAFHQHGYDFTGDFELHEAIRARGEK